jgi:hypothetical protein
MKKNITLLLFLAIGTVVFMASYRTKGENDNSSSTLLTSHSWRFENAESLNSRSELIVDHLYENAKYNFTTQKTYQGEFFEIPVQGSWTLEGERLILNKGKFEEEQFEIASITDGMLKLRVMERGASVTLTFR